jgi:uncharacterized repeat protein (TIGR01451 family)
MKLMNKLGNVMNKKFKAIASAMVVFALVIGIIGTPAATAVAVTQFGFDTGFDPALSDGAVTTTETTTQSGVVLTSQGSTYTECVLEASEDFVTVGDSIDLSWYTSGFDSIKVNGETVTSDSGSMTINNLQNDTVYTLQALSDSGAQCNQTVTVICLPPEVLKCELEVKKIVNKTTALPGENLTYTITVNNIGTTDCTGGGVKIEDVLDPNITYQSHQVSSNFTAGYMGTPVYTSGDRTLHFNGNVLTPGESGTITWIGKVNTPTQCGDFEVKNQAKATALELNNFGTWAYSPTVKTLIDNDCSTSKPCDLELHKTVNKATAQVNEELTYTITIKNNGDETCTGSGVLIEDVLDPNITYLRQTHSSNIGAGYLEKPVYTSADRTLHFNGFDLTPGESGTVTWVGKVNTPTQCGDFEVKNQAKATATELNNFQTWVYSEQVKTVIDNECYVPQSPTCTLLPTNQTLVKGGSAVFTWTTTNADTATLTDFGSVSLNGTGTTSPLTTGKDYILTVTGNGKTISCVAEVIVQSSPAPTCDIFTATPSTIMVGGTTTLAWETSNADQVFLNNGVGAVAADSSIIVSPLANIVYQLTVIGAEDQTISCDVPVTVTDDPKPICELFTATPSALSYGGGSVLLDWKVTGAISASISPIVGAVALTDSKTVPITQSTTFTLTAVDGDGDEVRCVAPVAVGDPIPSLTCADNVSFTASDYSIRRGDVTTLHWNTTNVDTVSISDIGATALSGSQAVSPAADTNYTLTATRGTESVSCPITIDVSSGGGGGGGGSASPRCELTISDSRIKSGEEVTLKWDTSNATEVTLSDDRGKTLATTADHLSSEKDDYYDGKITVKPTRDTVYTLLAERGSRDRECSVKVDIEDDVVVLQTRDQQPLIAGISLSQVPYTGFDAGPFMTAMFYLLLVAWAFFITYLLVLRNKTAGGLSITEPHISLTHNEMRMQHAETVRPDVFVKTTVAAPTHSGMVRTESTAPVNLPTNQVVVGYENLLDEPRVTVNPHQVSDSVVTELENRAHEQKALLSSDAVRHFIGTTSGEVERHQSLDEVIAEAKKTYPLEDGWIVINESRMRNLCEACLNKPAASDVVPFTPATVPVGSGSLAEAIVTGNIVAAYGMIGNSPMFALVDAAADLDALYRHRKDGNAKVSELLKIETEDLSDEQIKSMITALTGALDGTYTDEASAVKMAIMKAVKAAA